MAQQDRNRRGRNTPAVQRAQAGTAGRSTAAGQWPRSRGRSGSRGAALYPRFQFGHQRQLRIMNFLRAYQAQLDNQRNFVSRALESLSESVGGPTPLAYDTRGNYPGRGKATESKDSGSTLPGRSPRRDSGFRSDSAGQVDSVRARPSDQRLSGRDRQTSDDVVDAQEEDADAQEEDADAQEEDADSKDTESGDSDEADDDADNEPFGHRGDNPERRERMRARYQSHDGRDEPSSGGSSGDRQNALHGALTKLVRVHQGRALAPRLAAVNRHLLGQGQRPADLDELNRAFARWRRVNPAR